MFPPLVLLNNGSHLRFKLQQIFLEDFLSLIFTAESPESIEDIVQIIDDFEILSQQPLAVLGIIEVISEVCFQHDVDGQPHHRVVEIDLVADPPLAGELPDDVLHHFEDLTAATVTEEFEALCRSNIFSVTYRTDPRMKIL